MAAGGSTRIARATIAAAVVMLLAGPLIKYGVVPWGAGLGMFAVGGLLAAIGGVICLIQLLRGRRNRVTFVGLISGQAALLVLGGIFGWAGGLPQIHDISTDTAEPPQFVRVTPALRGVGSNPTGYDPRVATAQAAAYPGVKPLVIGMAPAAAFDRALAVARGQGFEIVDADAGAGRIEATDTVAWWGFKDDVVVRLRPEGSGTRIDMRSKSRVGLGDLGVNAARVEGYLAAIAAR